MDASKEVPALPPGRRVPLLGRGTTFLRELPGPPGAPVVVLLHGLSATADLNWFSSYYALGERFRVLAIDQRGHGRGVRSLKPFRLDDCADDVAALAEQTGIDRLIAVGYSMGGPVAQLLWRRHPDLVEGMVLCATSSPLAVQDPLNFCIASGALGLSVMARLTPRPLLRSITTSVIRARLDGSKWSNWIASECARHDAASLLQALAAVRTFDSRRWLGSLDVPTAVVVTTHDHLVSPSRQRALAYSIPGATLHPVDADHGACIDGAGKFVPVLLQAVLEVADRASRSHDVSQPRRGAAS